MELDNIDATSSRVRLFKNGFFVNFLNPKLSIFFLAFIPQFVTTKGDDVFFEMILLGLTFMFLTFVIFVVYGNFAHVMKRKVVQSPSALRVLHKCFSLIFVLLAYKMANLSI